VPLGVFPSLKVTYKPANKFHHQTGVLNKSSNLVNEQKMVVKNNGQKSVLFTILEPIPKATDEKIKASSVGFTNRDLINLSKNVVNLHHKKNIINLHKP
jgi:hypothetical protein